MRQVLGDLCALLNDQKSVLEGMLELSRKERQILIEGKSEKLEEVVRQELHELSKLGAIEKKRAALHKEIAAEIGAPEQGLTVSVIAGKAEPDERKEIERLQKELTSIISQHSALNIENRELIKAHLEYSETMLDMMVGTEDPLNNFYGVDGRAAPEKKRITGLFDSRA